MNPATCKTESVEVTVEEALRMEVIINQALTDLLIEKGIITEKELLAKISVIRGEMEQGDSEQ